MAFSGDIESSSRGVASRSRTLCQVWKPQDSRRSLFRKDPCTHACFRAGLPIQVAVPSIRSGQHLARHRECTPTLTKSRSVYRAAIIEPVSHGFLPRLRSLCRVVDISISENVKRRPKNGHVRPCTTDSGKGELDRPQTAGQKKSRPRFTAILRGRLRLAFFPSGSGGRRSIQLSYGRA